MLNLKAAVKIFQTTFGLLVSFGSFMVKVGKLGNSKRRKNVVIDDEEMK